MRPLSGASLLSAWEQGQSQHPVDRALTLLAAGWPEASFEELAGLSIGRRDARLLALRRATFGEVLRGFVSCPVCAEALELELRTSELLLQDPEVDAGGDFTMTVDGRDLRFRLPDSRDLAAAAVCAGAEEASARIADRCFLATTTGDPPPAALTAALATAMAAADPQADLSLALRCAACAHEWSDALDVQGFFWSEIDAAAVRLLDDVDRLARVYGWSEAEILAMSPRRRRRYLELAGR
ncbi:MAG: phage baseplate protein [Planctomycetota bacterium]|nr:MAG: phage baseplate protein [Planctomycetota bacterium]